MTKFRKLNRPTGHGMSMLRTMVSQLVKHERIETTVSKGSLCAARRAAAFLRGDDIEKVDIQDYFELVYELVMQLQWPILSLLAEKMSLGSQNRQPHNHHQELP
ncbi:probable 39S ribosomal protein L17, mitochondrial isoform X3 [Mangifera indica]|uniref:probable 39S ribosomal protein L17, mitochondrial isoform X3 n=1 Tax=Mangifera indica TaxID=29780 RepID=UPI001CF94B84|nr:probable 39S ribosomal protein L17, mitochondrial isoform X3 [Mangifera indica]